MGSDTDFHGQWRPISGGGAKFWIDNEEDAVLAERVPNSSLWQLTRISPEGRFIIEGRYSDIDEATAGAKEYLLQEPLDRYAAARRHGFTEA